MCSRVQGFPDLFTGSKCFLVTQEIAAALDIIDANGARSQTCRAIVDAGCTAGTELMSATASPGRTWLISRKCRMPNLAAAATAALFRGGDCGPCLSDLARADSSAQ